MAKSKEKAEETLKEEEVNAEMSVSDEKIPSEEQSENERAEAILLAKAEKELAELKKALAETEDRYLRTLAEYDNFKKRTVREKEELYFASKSDVIKKLLPVFDNFERAQMFSDGEEYKKGVDMIVHQFFEILSSMEVRKITETGDPFDPMFHEAVFREEKEGVPENTVTEVLQNGYAVGDKVIRHAMVKVSG